MNIKRRGLVGGASALAAASVSSAALAKPAPAVVAPMLAAAAADASRFEAALRGKFAEGAVLNWSGGNVRLRRPIHIDVTKSTVGAGLDLNGAKLIADFNNPKQRAITIRIPPAYRSVALRGIKFFDGTIVAESRALDAIGLICATRQSWIYSWKIMNLDIEQFERDALHFAGHVFEGELHGVTCASNGRNGITFRNEGAEGDVGTVSAISVFGGQMRKNGNAGIETQSSVAYQEPRDLNIWQTYFVENKGPGINSPAGLSRAQGCGFQNNGGCGINLMNEARLTDCRASTNGSQPYLVKAYFNKGGMTFDSCRIEGYGALAGKMKLAKVGGVGTVSLRDSGEASDLDISGEIAVKVS